LTYWLLMPHIILPEKHFMWKSIKLRLPLYASNTSLLSLHKA
jgi:hypothetical protein